MLNIFHFVRKIYPIIDRNMKTIVRLNLRAGLESGLYNRLDQDINCVECNIWLKTTKLICTWQKYISHNLFENFRFLAKINESLEEKRIECLDYSKNLRTYCHYRCISFFSLSFDVQQIMSKRSRKISKRCWKWLNFSFFYQIYFSFLTNFINAFKHCK